MNEVLLAEDEPVSRHFLSEALTLLHWHCTAAPEGNGALALAQSRRFDLLVLDLNLPGISGSELLARLRADSDAASHSTPALALSADPDPDIESRMRLRGFVAIGRKPITIDALDALIRAGLGRAKSSGAPSGPCLPTWDDAAALRAGGGQHAIVVALRDLMRGELPAQRARIFAAIAADDRPAARAELHRMKAACGFCGAAALSAALDDVHAALQLPRPVEPETLSRFLAAVDQVLSEPAPEATPA